MVAPSRNGTNGPMPIIFIMRFKLYASTCSLISVPSSTSRAKALDDGAMTGIWAVARSSRKSFNAGVYAQSQEYAPKTYSGLWA